LPHATVTLIRLALIALPPDPIAHPHPRSTHLKRGFAKCWQLCDSAWGTPQKGLGPSDKWAVQWVVVWLHWLFLPLVIWNFKIFMIYV